MQAGLQRQPFMGTPTGLPKQGHAGPCQPQMGQCRREGLPVRLMEAPVRQPSFEGIHSLQVFSSSHCHVCTDVELCISI